MSFGALKKWCTLAVLAAVCSVWGESSGPGPVSIQKFGVLPENAPEVNQENLQKAIDWASRCGAALYVEPVEEPYPIKSGVILKQNASLIGAHGPTGR